MSGTTSLPFSEVAPIIQGIESGGNPTAQNPTSTASGLFQDINATWRYALGLIGLSPSQYPTAKSAPSSVQYQANEALYNAQGLQPWAGDIPQIETQLGLPAGSLGSSGTATTGSPTAATGQAQGGGCGFSPSCWLGSLGSWAGGLAARAGLILLAVILLLGAVWLFAARTQISQVEPAR